MSPSITREAVLEALRQVQDPDLHRDIVSLDFVKDLTIEGGRVAFRIELTTPACPVKDELQRQAEERVAALPGVENVTVAMDARVPASPASSGTGVLAGVRHAVAVASGKGGVGKSTVAVNVAAALAREGARVGLLDADIYGPSIPIMLGLRQSRPEVRAGKLVPLERFGIRMMSIGFIAGEETPVIWRGPMVSKLVQQFLADVDWGDLDYLIIDLPPGTGDAQLTLSQAAPLAGAVIVTTPQPVALEDVKRGVRMFEKVNVPILGIVENMALFVCPTCGSRHEIFSHGGGEAAAREFEVPFLGEVPIDPSIRAGGDTGVPVVVSHPEGPSAHVFRQIAQRIARELSILAFPTPAGSGP
ncbi:MAG TPA: Mrp/NBP35 family ATP-binding protein [Candidatus Eisenbacteria bacterium]|nr:Mrp/NBP35 family ATP-binding protein [Candidatus Eisenbacteria bacterium]